MKFFTHSSGVLCGRKMFDDLCLCSTTVSKPLIQRALRLRSVHLSGADVHVRVILDKPLRVERVQASRRNNFRNTGVTVAGRKLSVRQAEQSN